MSFFQFIRENTLVNAFISYCSNWYNYGIYRSFQNSWSDFCIVSGPWLDFLTKVLRHRALLFNATLHPFHTLIHTFTDFSILCLSKNNNKDMTLKFTFSLTFKQDSLHYNIMFVLLHYCYLFQA